MSNFDPVWTKPRVETLTRMWTEGYSCSLIAAELGGGISRSAVIGKRDRLKLPSRREGHLPPIHRPNNYGNRKGVAPHSKRRRKAKSNGGVPEQDAMPPQPIDDLAIPIAQRRTILELTEDTCKWPVGDPDRPGFFFCGGTPKHGLPYCAAHCCIAYQPASTLRSRAEAKPWRD